MKQAVIVIPVFVLTGIGVAGPALALPAMPPHDAMTLFRSSALLPVRYYWHHHRHWRFAGRSTGDAVKPGQWQFTSELQAPPPRAGTQSPPQSRPPTNSAAKTTYMACIASDTAAPAGLDPRCKLDDTQRQGSNVTWSMSCANTRVRSDGSAQYHGETMDGWMISHVPSANGTVTDLTQRISGRYLGPCTRSAQNRMPSPQNGTGSSTPEAAQPSAAAERAVPQAAAGENAATAQPRERHARRYVRHWHYARHRRYWHYYWPFWF